MGYYLISTTTVSEFIASMEHMHVPQKIIIPMAVMFRFFPTIGEEARSISNAMRMRRVGFSSGGFFNGESGCGKTTLTRLINGLIPNYYEGFLTGEILINGRAIHKLPLYETSKVVGSVFQNPRSQFFNVDTTSELAFACENMGLSVEEIKQRIRKTVFYFNIEILMNRSIFHLSGGEKQKIACASVSTVSPDIFVLDEPSSNLDVTAIDDLRQLIEMWKSQGKTIIIAEHRLYFMRELADRILYMKNGKIERELNNKEIKKNQFRKIFRHGA
ncbi:ATP-binding cassette domain-containing protein [Halocella sp. SP3-1]|uniref:ATP-binding cassette domain-containing protein n=1 Tax=Halocella sp. SP3-1 TaxID=2382161 RepID=UPI00197A70DE|nr:ATP-binding cassette domain-containing protein [Halocella sp. SP3-1]